jgi:hypothetical protein
MMFIDIYKHSKSNAQKSVGFCSYIHLFRRQMRMDTDKIRQENEQDEIVENEVYKLQVRH